MSTTIDWKTAAKKTIHQKEFLMAISDNNFEEMDRLVEEGIDINFKDQDGYIAIFIAIEHADSTVVKYLVDKGANLNVKNRNQESPIDLARRMSRFDIVEILDNEKSNNAQASASKDGVVSQNGPEKLDNSVQSNKKYTLLNNAVHGNIYQLKFLMLFLYRGVTCQYSFRLGTEVKEAQKFDDLVFEYTQNHKKVYRLLQVKHKIDESKKITADKLLSEVNGDYNLVKYFHSYQACKRDNFFNDGLIKDVTICTNIDFDFANLEEANIGVYQLEGKDDILDLKSKEKEPIRYKFSDSVIPKLIAKLKNSKYYEKLEISNCDIEDFLQHLVFAVNQPNEEELGNIVKAEIGKELDFITTENVYNKFFIRMLDWMKGRSDFITYTEGQELIENMRKDIFVWFNVQDPIKSFTGRLDELKNIHELLQTEETQIICLSGLGGVGKSELVKKYIADYGYCYENKVVWINAENYQTLVNSFRQLASDKLDISTINTDGKEKDVNSIISQVYQYFSKSKSLFIFDNAEVYMSNDEFESGISKFLPTLPSGCIKPYIIITSRNKKWPESIKVKILEGFTKKEAVSFVSKNLHLNLPKQKEQARKLASKLQLLPLALQQAVAYIKSQNEDLDENEKAFQISDYLERFSGKSEEILNFKFPSHSDNVYSNTVFTTWNVTLDAMKKIKNGNDAINLLNIIAYLLPNDISEKTLLSFVQNKETLESSVELLRQYSLIEIQNGMVNIHRLVQQVTRMKLVEMDQEKEILGKCLKAMEKDILNLKNVNQFVSIWTHCRKYRSLLKLHASGLGNLGHQLTFCGRAKESYVLVAELHKVLEESLPENVTTQFELLRFKNNNASSLLVQLEYEKALEEFKQCYQLAKQLVGPYDEQTLLIKTNMGNTLTSLGKYNEALECLQEAVKDCEEHLGESHRRTFVAKIDLTKVLIAKGNYIKALSICRESLAKIKSIKAGDPVTTSMTIKYSMAHALWKLNKAGEALKIYQEIYEYQKTNYGDDHPQTFCTRNSMAVMLDEQGDKNAALEIFNDVFKKCKKLFGENHHYTLEAKNSIADILESQGNNKNAAFERVQDQYESHKKLFGENHPDTLKIHTVMACSLMELDKHDDAITILQEAYVKQKAIYGLCHPEVEKTLLILTGALERQGKDAESLKAYEDLLQCQLSLYKANDEMTLLARFFISKSLMNDKKYDAALEHYTVIHEIYTNKYGTNASQTLECKYRIGTIHFFRKQYDEAFRVLTEVCKAQEDLYGKYHSVCNNTRDQIAAVVTELQKCKIQDKALDGSRITNLIKAVQNNELSIVEKLVKEGADINTADTNKGTLLHHAVNLNSKKIIKFLLKNGADVTCTTIKGNTPLHMATLKGDFEVVKILLENVNHDKLQKFIDAKTLKSGSTALHIAAKNGLLQITRYLLSRGATYDIKNNEDQLPVDIAMDGCVKDMLKNISKLFKLANSANKEVSNILKRYSMDEFLARASARNSQGYNLGQVVVLKNNGYLAKSFHDLRIRQFLNIYTTAIPDENLDGLYSCANYAYNTTEAKELSLDEVFKAAHGIVQMFRSQHNCKPNPNIDTIDDMVVLFKSSTGTPAFAELAKNVIKVHLVRFLTSIQSKKLLKAAKSNDLNEVEELVNTRVDVNVKDDGGWTPLHHATNAKNRDMVSLFISQGARVNCITNFGKFTPLHIAVSKGDVEIVGLLLNVDSIVDESKTLVDAKTEEKGSTALHIAAKNGQSDIVRTLLYNHANYQVKNKIGQTPADLTSNEDIKKLFKLVDDLFVEVTKGNIEVIEKLKVLSTGTFIIVTSVRNEDGYTLEEVAALSNHYKIADKIGKMILAITNQARDVDHFYDLILS